MTNIYDAAVDAWCVSVWEGGGGKAGGWMHLPPPTIIDLAYFTQPLGVKCVIYHSYHDDMFVLSVC